MSKGSRPADEPSGRRRPAQNRPRPASARDPGPLDTPDRSASPRSNGAPPGGPALPEAGAAPGAPASGQPIRITVGVACNTLGRVPRDCGKVDPPIDVISVGHYLGMKPQRAELELDTEISKALLGGGKAAKTVAESDLLLTQLTERGVIRGELAELFFLPDPRTDEALGGGEGDGTSVVDRTVVVAGMGMPGRFAVPELVVLSRELSWTLGRMGKRHLATVLIGAGAGNIPIPIAVHAWLRGLASTAAGSPFDTGRLLRRVTFIEFDPANALRIDDAIREGLDALRERRARLLDEQNTEQLDEEDRVEFLHVALDGDRKRKLADDAIERARARLVAELHGLDATSGPPEPERGQEPTPTRLTVVQDAKAYRFAAITRDATMPEREVPIEPLLVREVNDELAVPIDTSLVGDENDFHAAVGDALQRQCEQGQLMGHLLLPADLRGHLASAEPVVLMLDATTARIHWEMVALPDRGNPATNRDLAPSNPQEQFLGLSRGLTRQLRTMFAPPPEPPPPPRRVLRVLVVANPASEDHPLPNADREGDEVKALFEAYNEVHGASSRHRVEVVLLKGAQEATRTEVLRHLMVKRPYDVLHYTGHCRFFEEEPESSGWLFAGEKYITARELSRIDRIPKFVFSNACESGITPDRAAERDPRMAPSFAEAFFARGVSNFLCTAWPVDDGAGRKFVLELYAALLGLKFKEGGGTRSPLTAEPQAMHEAMLRARLRILKMPKGVSTWGAYQHYGNPFFRFFEKEPAEAPDAPSNGKRPGKNVPPS